MEKRLKSINVVFRDFFTICIQPGGMKYNINPSGNDTFMLTLWCVVLLSADFVGCKSKILAASFAFTVLRPVPCLPLTQILQTVNGNNFVSMKKRLPIIHNLLRWLSVLFFSVESAGSGRDLLLFVCFLQSACQSWTKIVQSYTIWLLPRYSWQCLQKKKKNCRKVRNNHERSNKKQVSGYKKEEGVQSLLTPW